MEHTNKYTQKLSTIDYKTFTNMTDPFYLELNPLVDQEVLDHAHIKGENFVKDFTSQYNYLIELRPTKKFKRFEEKKKKANADINFKSNSDFIALRVCVELNDIPNKINDFNEFIKSKANGFCYERNPIVYNDSDPNNYYFLRNPNDSESKYRDIVSYVYAYSPKYEYIIEYQIAHKFAVYTFTRDSYLRDNPTNPLGLVDLWEGNFYTHTKNYLLGLNKNVNLLEELEKLYKSKSKNIEPKLYLMIQDITNL